MCGICGIVNHKSNRAPRPETLSAMMETMVHRGPDDHGAFYREHVGLGFRRLSIIDLDGGHQPMSDPAGRYTIVFNGEIYNYRELRAELIGAGHTFRTSSDTEVVLVAYAQWGDKSFERLSGMFAVAIWDAERRRLLVVRDSMGIKPIYYAETPEGVVFGSEVRAVTAGGVDPAIEPASIYLFLQHRFVPAPLTMFAGIKKLPAGSLLEVDDGGVRRRRWYTLRRRDPGTLSARDAIHELDALYAAAVKRHLVSDVPVGLLLSGGVDSALLLSYMNDTGGPWDTFTVGYGEDYRNDELSDARRSSRLLGSNHHEVILSRQSFEDSLPSIVQQLEEPVASSSIVPMFHVSKTAREHVKVALIGQGPDELFGGYLRHYGPRYGRYWRTLPAGVRRVLGSSARRVSSSETLRRAVYALDTPDTRERFRDILSLMDFATMDTLFREEYRPVGGDSRLTSIWDEEYDPDFDGDELGAFQCIELSSTLPDELLIYGDKLSMANSLEVRVPYLDREVVEFAVSLPESLKIRGMTRKWVHKEVARQRLGREITRRRKRAFAADVVDDWFRSGIGFGLRTLLEDPESLVFRYLDATSVRSLTAGHEAGSIDAHKLLFSIVVLEYWLRANWPNDSDAARPAEAPLRAR